jgi:hypothetical protein
MNDPIGVYRTVDGNATVRYSGGQHRGMDIANPSTGWAAYNKAGLAWRASEDQARAIMNGRSLQPPQHPDDDRHPDDAPAE